MKHVFFASQLLTAALVDIITLISLLIKKSDIQNIIIIDKRHLQSCYKGRTTKAILGHNVKHT